MMIYNFGIIEQPLWFQGYVPLPNGHTVFISCPLSEYTETVNEAKQETDNIKTETQIMIESYCSLNKRKRNIFKKLFKL